MWVGEVMECGELRVKKVSTKTERGRSHEHCGASSFVLGEVWCLRGSEMRILRIEGSMVRVICGVQLNNRKSVKDLMLILCLNEAIDHLLVTVRDWYGLSSVE